MNILENVSLAAYSTMRLGGNAAFLTEVQTQDDVMKALGWASQKGLPAIMIGEGSNIVWDDDGYPGIVLVNKIQGFETSSAFDDSLYVTAGSGMRWDDFVAKTVAMGLTGVELLSLVPGTVGATPIQNVGAYGAEVSSTITTILAFDNTVKALVTLRASDCSFGYRTSRFKTTDKNRFFIINVTFMLRKGEPTPPFYGALQQYLSDHAITNYTAAAIRDAVIAIRSSKLPDPATVANNGSFFANPIIATDLFTQLMDNYPDIPHWQTDDGRVKISGAWLLEQAGFKNYSDPETGMATWPNQPLVVINQSATTTAQLKTFKAKLIDGVQSKFGITLEQEPELI